jgi:hypothetical protein
MIQYGYIYVTKSKMGGTIYNPVPFSIKMDLHDPNTCGRGSQDPELIKVDPTIILAGHSNDDESGLIQEYFIKGRGLEIFGEFRPPPALQ